MQFWGDFGVIARCLLALLWGMGLAAFLQFNRIGQYLAVERTWVTVVAGIGVDMLLAIGGDWLTCALVIVCSSLGVIARSLINESQHTPDLNSYKTKWAMEDVIDLSGDVIGLLEHALSDGHPDGWARVSAALGMTHRAQRIMTATRYGDAEHRRRAASGRD